MSRGFKRSRARLTSTIIINSRIRTGRPLFLDESPRARMKTTSVAVRRTATGRGRLGNSNTKPIADPRSSARSVLMIASSDST